MPVELECVVTDGYDREVFARIVAKSAALTKTKDRFERLLPHGALLLQDLFASLYKLNVALKPESEISGAVLLHRRVLDAVRTSRPLVELRRRTELSEAECAAALPALADRILGALTREYRFGAGELMDLAKLAEDEEALARMKAEREHVDEMPDGVFDDKAKDALKDDLSGDIDALAKKIAKSRGSQSKLAAKLTSELEDTVEQKIHHLPGEIDEASEHLKSLGLGSGADGRVSPERRLELGERLMKSKKLKLLARLVGAFREVAFEARRRRVVRTPQVLHAVNLGSHLDRLLPSELLGLGRTRRALHLEFLRKFVEGELLEYELLGGSSRGPMVICVDGSGSMTGSKEIWAKAVALTLMEIARREKRRALALVFSSGSALAEFEFLSDRPGGGGRARVRDEEILRFAEHFPGGGTSFEEPLGRAVEAVSTGRYRRGDIVFITDGEANVSPELIASLKEKRKKHRFYIRGILVDVAHSRGETLEAFSDEVRRVSDLAADSLSDLFAAV